jgi:hypothetical protein
VDRKRVESRETFAEITRYTIEAGPTANRAWNWKLPIGWVPVAGTSVSKPVDGVPCKSGAEQKLTVLSFLVICLFHIAKCSDFGI